MIAKERRMRVLAPDEAYSRARPESQQGARERDSSRVLGALGQRVALVRIGFGLIWLIDAWYKWQPAFRHQYAGIFTRIVRNQPAILQPWFHFWSGLVTPHAFLFWLLTAVAETGLALCLILGFARRPIYCAGALLSLMIWTTAESFGRLWTAGQTDLGTSIMYVFIFAALLTVDAFASTRRWSLDAWLERHAPWWSRFAELGSGGA